MSLSTRNAWRQHVQLFLPILGVAHNSTSKAKRNFGTAMFIGPSYRRLSRRTYIRARLPDSADCRLDSSLYSATQFKTLTIPISNRCRVLWRAWRAVVTFQKVLISCTKCATYSHELRGYTCKQKSKIPRFNHRLPWRVNRIITQPQTVASSTSTR